MAASSIEWTQLTWNPTTGCSKISAGCKNCYAEIMSRRLKAMGLEKYRLGFKLAIHDEELITPYLWKKPKIVFVNSMSDLFHEEIPESFIQKVFHVMNETPQHVYQILTKRSGRILEMNNKINWSNNIWMGVSVEDSRVKYRINDLQRSDAKVKFLSCEPLIGPIGNVNFKGIDWVIVGGESGPKARPIKLKWINEIKTNCDNNKIAFFFKQWGKSKYNINKSDPTIEKDHPNHAKGGCLIDGELFRQMPVF